MMKREDRGKMNELCEKLGRVEEALERFNANAWNNQHLSVHVGRTINYNGPGEIHVKLDSAVALKVLKAEEERLRSAMADIGVAP